MVDGLHGLGHDAVVRGHHQNGDVRNHGAAGTHGGKRLVARRIQEGNGLSVQLHLIRADVLGDAARFALGDRGVADGVQQGGLAVVHVAHNHHHGSAGNQLLFLVLVGVNQLLLNSDGNLVLHLAVKLQRHQSGGVIVNHLGQRGHNAAFHQHLNHLRAGFLHAGGQFTYADFIGNGNLQGRLFGNLKLKAAHFLLLILPPLVGKGHAGAGAAVVVGAKLLLSRRGSLHPPGLVGRHLLQPFVILRQIHVAALAGVHHLFLGDPGGGLSQRRLCLSGGRLGINRPGRGMRRGRGRPLGRGRRSGGLLGRLFHGGLGGRRRGDALLLLCRLAVGIGKNLLNAGRRMGLGQGLKHQRQLFVGQRLHIALGGLAILPQNLHDVLVAQA
ncbi:hypothetical protein SDC9_121307 [bioreactor metagenome]|uniref:NAD-specific glutamate dehydrogenase n=1 Tax=bioreactor metagenome TaxID=1076179 RepID=A0A645CBL6_9ZZZZ